MVDRAPQSVSMRQTWRQDLPASFVVFLVALPLCMGIAIASGAPVTAGLVTGIVGGLIVGTLAGAPLQVSGPAAGLTVIVYQLIQEHGIEMLGVVVLLAGALQILAGVFKLGQWFRAVSPAVIQGMLAGIGVLIFAGQFHVMVDDRPKKNGVENLLTIPEAIAKATPLPFMPGGDAGDRGLRTDQLRQSSLLHLRQAELAEEVHHLAIGLAKDDAGEVQTDAVAENRETAAPLQDLATRQSQLAEDLARLNVVQGTAERDAALAACREALADLTVGNVQTARTTQDRAVTALGDFLGATKSHSWAATIGLVTIMVIVVWQGFVAKRVKFIPAPLAAVAAGTILAISLNVPVLNVEVPDNLLEEIFLPSWAELRELANPGIVFLAVQIAVIASAETLLCAAAVDQLHQGPRTKYDRELIAQGVGNMTCGFLGALPMTGVIVRSSANLQAGAKSRLSAILHGVWLLLFVAVLSFVLRLIPTASLAAVLVFTGYKLVNPKVIKSLLIYGKSEAAIYVGTMVTIVVSDLLTGVLAGIGLSILKLLYTFSHLKITVREEPDRGRVTLILKGSATFLRLPKLAQALEQIPPQTEVHLYFERLAYIDHACLDLLVNWEKQHEATGGRLIIDWNALAARFRSAEKMAADDSLSEVSEESKSRMSA